MSRIGRKPIQVPANVKVAIKGRTISVTGPQGSQEVTFPEVVSVTWAESEKAITCTVPEGREEDRVAKALWGTARANIQNAIVGVTKGYQKDLEVVGVGWTATVTGQKLKLTVGFANAIMVDVPKDVKVVVDKQFLRISGPGKQAVGQLAADIRSRRKPEPYNGKGIKYTTETIKRKSGKAFGAA